MNGITLILALTPASAELAERLAGALGDAEVVRAGRWAKPVDGRVGAVDALRDAYLAGRPIVGICAAGVVVRALAPVIADKSSEPPVVVLAEDASAVVPLLGAHRGAGRLAARIGEATGATVAATGASDLRFGVALDDPPPGWRLANPHDHKAFAAALLAGDTAVRIEGDAPWLEQAALPLASDAALAIHVTDADRQGGPRELVYHPARLCVGVGCERDAPAGDLIALVESTLAEHGLAAGAVSGVFSLDLKSDEPAVEALAAWLGVQARFFPAARLEAERDRLASPSDVVYREVGCHGVAEGAALAAAGPEAVLVAPKRIDARVTCALARAPGPVDAGVLGAARGHLAVIGLGPGDPALTTPQASAALAKASDLVGYSAYLDLVAPRAAPGRRHPYPLGEERARVVAALDAAAAGGRVALVCSGDPGIYAMAALVMETLDGADRPDWGRVAIDVLPGISALQMAAARAGAPIGHDFCAISLSDLLTPWSAIERRLHAAADGDFVVALYNPVSRRRTHQLGRALEILGAARPGATPVVVARSLGRAGEQVRLTTLGDPDVADVDMVTVVLVGASSTRPVSGHPGRVYTPRGYAVESGSHGRSDA